MQGTYFNAPAAPAVITDPSLLHALFVCVCLMKKIKMLKSGGGYRIFESGSEHITSTAVEMGP